MTRLKKFKLNFMPSIFAYLPLLGCLPFQIFCHSTCPSTLPRSPLGLPCYQIVCCTPQKEKIKLINMHDTQQNIQSHHNTLTEH